MSIQIDDELFKDWLNAEKRCFETTLRDPKASCMETEHLIAAIKMEFLKDVIKAYEQSTCEHKETIIRESVGYDIDDEGEEDQSVETCKQCGAERFICDHSKHGKTTGCWFISL
jgi:hypothetical protein